MGQDRGPNAHDASGLEHRDRIAVVTGGGRGFGKTFGHALAGLGATVILIDIDTEAAARARAEIEAAGGAVFAESCDIADEAQVSAAIGRIVARHGGIDILINNAGLHSEAYSGAMADMGLGKVRRLFDVNVMGTITCSLAACDAMRGRPGAAIVNIASTASYPPLTAYGVSKLAVSGLTMAFAREFAALGIRVNAIAPGLIFTDTIRTELPAAMVSAVVDRQILKREGAEDDVVQAMLYFISSRSAFVTGETLRVSGGFGLSI